MAYVGQIDWGKAKQPAMKAGDYAMELYQSVVKNKEKDNKPVEVLELKFKVVEGKCEGRVLQVNIFIRHPNEKAVSFSYKTTVNLLSAYGIEGDQFPAGEVDTLQGKKVIAKIEIDPPNDWHDYPMPQIKSFLPYKEGKIFADTTEDDKFFDADVEDIPF